MTSSRVRIGTAVVALVLVLAACGGAASSSAPASASGAASASASPSASPEPSVSASSAASESAAASPSVGGLPSVDPSLAGQVHQDPSLEAQLPDTVGNAQLTKFSVKGNSVLASGASTPQVQAVLGALGKTLDDVSIAIAGGTGVAVGVYRINGVDANQLLTLIAQAMQQSGETGTVTDVNKGGKSLKLGKASEPSGTDVYFYPKGDLLFFVSGDDDALVTAAISALP